jgi:hypothetical protein
VKNPVAYQAVYDILLEVIDQREVISYRQLSDAYENRTGDRVHWRNWAPVLDYLGDWSP